MNTKLKDTLKSICLQFPIILLGLVILVPLFIASMGLLFGEIIFQETIIFTLLAILGLVLVLYFDFQMVNKILYKEPFRMNPFSKIKNETKN